MNTVSRVPDRRPVVFTLSALLAWFLAAGVTATVAALLLHAPTASVVPQRVGTLTATGILLLVLRRLGWLRPMGLTALGTWSTWALTLLLGAYVVFSGFYSFFGELAFDARALFDTREARVILLNQVIVGVVEETVFRGILLYGLVRAWGRTRPGLMAAVVIQAALFGVPHILQVFAGAPLSSVLANVANTFVFGVWLGFLVLSTGSLWPAILLHAVANGAVLIKGLSSPWVDLTFLGYIRATLFDLVLVLIGSWVVLRVGSLRCLRPRGLSGPNRMPSPDLTLPGHQGSGR